MRRVFLDSSVLLLAAGAEHPLREACRGLVRAVAEKRVEGHVSTEGIQELVFHRMRKGDEQAVRIGRGMATICTLHAFDDRVLDRALALIDEAGMRGRDAVHAATAILAGFSQIVSADADFEGVPGLSRVDPSEALDRL